MKLSFHSLDSESSYFATSQLFHDCLAECSGSVRRYRMRGAENKRLRVPAYATFLLTSYITRKLIDTSAKKKTIMLNFSSLIPL